MGEVPIAALPGAARAAPDPGSTAWPDVGEHSEAVLASFGFGDAEINRLIESKAAGTVKPR
jgi:crotonobetainyl-CoA:carnitine CoA-transferase CaiB-like acyl-CoA transferase